MAMPAAPSSANRIAVACPIPEAAPVTAKYLFAIPDIVSYVDMVGSLIILWAMYWTSDGFSANWG